jgi:hypothetical protein
MTLNGSYASYYLERTKTTSEQREHDVGAGQLVQDLHVMVRALSRGVTAPGRVARQMRDRLVLGLRGRDRALAARAREVVFAGDANPRCRDWAGRT